MLECLCTVFNENLALISSPFALHGLFPIAKYVEKQWNKLRGYRCTVVCRNTNKIDSNDIKSNFYFDIMCLLLEQFVVAAVRTILNGVRSYPRAKIS
jgi:hypothetical protein